MVLFVLMFAVHKVVGSNDINIKKTVKERCFIYVEMDVYSSHRGPFHRNNLDKTFYPVDTFDYSTTTWKDNCRDFLITARRCNIIKITF